MSLTKEESNFTVNLEKLAKVLNQALYVFTLGSFLLAYYKSHYFYYLGSFFLFVTLLNIYYRHIQKKHALLSNFGILAQLRYLLESLGPELRQYLFMSDTEEKPFSRLERAEVYRKSKGIELSAAFGSLDNFGPQEIKLRHSMYPMNKQDMSPFSLTFGDLRNCPNPYTIDKPFMISAMSYGSLSQPAVRALSRGAKKSGVVMNTGEGGFPKYHLMEGADLIFQMGTAKFGVRNDDSSLNDEKLKKLANENAIKMIEIKLSQGAKPGKGGILPKEKINKEISELRGVPMGEDVLSPSSHIECKSPEKTVQLIKRVQEVSQKPVGIKLCFGRRDEFQKLVEEMKSQDVFPDYIAIDGSEGGTGAAPKVFLDDVGVPIYKALVEVNNILNELNVRDRTKIIASGKLFNAGKQMIALSLGADAIYVARGFMLSIGCIQSLLCNNNRCPVGITTHDPHLTAGLDIEDKSERAANYVRNLWKDHKEVLAALGKKQHSELNRDNLFIPFDSIASR